MTVSVVIPTYNRAHCVSEAIASVLGQTFDDLEVVVVDDGSTDDTARRVRAFSDPRVRYVLGRHAGVSAARNLGVARSTGALIAFLDSDDLWMPEKVEQETVFLAAHPEVDAVFSDLEKRHKDRTVGSFMRQTAVFSARLTEASYPDGVSFSQREMFLCLLEEIPIKPSALTLRRAAFEAAGGFDESWSSSEDWEFLLRFARRFRFGYIDRPLAVLRISGDSLHVVDQARGESSMIRLMTRERGSLDGDREALTALQRGLVTRVKHFAWYHEDRHRPRAAAAVYWRGFRLTADLGLFLRAVRMFLQTEIPTPTPRNPVRVPAGVGRR